MRCIGILTRISHHLTAEARERPAITSLRLLPYCPSTPPLVKRRAPRTDGPLTHFASPPGEQSGLDAMLPTLMVSLAPVFVFLRSKTDGSAIRNMLFVFLRPLGAALLGYPTQGSASLHPWATIQRHFAAQKLYPRLKGSIDTRGI